MKTVFKWEGNISFEPGTLVKVNHRYFKITSIDSDNELSMEYVGFFKNYWLRFTASLMKLKILILIGRALVFFNRTILKALLFGCGVLSISLPFMAVYSFSTGNFKEGIWSVGCYLLNVTVLAYAIHGGGRSERRTEENLKWFENYAHDQEFQKQKILGMMCGAYGTQKIKTGYSKEAEEAFKKSFTNLQLGP